MIIHRVISHLRKLLSVNYEEPLLRYVVFRLDDVESGHSPINRNKLLFLTFFTLATVASLSIVEPFVIPAANNLFFVDASKHATLELFCGLISGIIAFILAWEYQLSGKKNILWLVFAFFSIGILDIFHAFSDYDYNTFVWFHSCSAFFGSRIPRGFHLSEQKDGRTCKIIMDQKRSRCLGDRPDHPTRPAGYENGRDHSQRLVNKASAQCECDPGTRTI